MPVVVNLRAERERQGLSLDEVASQAQIPLRYLEALESGDAAFRRSILPSGPFLRSYQRQYLEFLGLDPEVIDEQGALLQEGAEPQDHEDDEEDDGASGDAGALPPAAEPTLTSPGDPGEIPLMRLVIAGFMLTLAMVLGLRVVSLLVDSGGGRARDAEPAPEPPVAAVSAAASGEPAEPPPIPEEIQEAAAEDVTEDGPPTPAQLAALPTARLRIRAVEPTRITARVDEQDAYQGTLPAGDVIDLEAKDEIEVWAADLTTILITYNGERIEPLGNLSQGRKLVFIHDGGK